MFSNRSINNGNPTDGDATNRKWFGIVAIFMLCWIALYAFLHWDKIHVGYSYSKFTTAQIQEINRILYDKDAQDRREAQAVVTPAGDSVWSDSLGTPAPKMVAAVARRADVCDDSCHINKAMLYIRNEFDNKIKDEQMEVIRQYISSFSSQEVGLFLAELKVKVRSYFWLTGPLVYLEIIFWVIIGVACSILFAIGNATRDPNNPKIAFHESDIPYHLAKLFYAPFCTIIIVLSYNYIKHRNVIEVNTNEGMMVFSFIAGLFSGRLMSLLERFKDVLLPEHTLTTPAADNNTVQSSYINPLNILAPKPNRTNYNAEEMQVNTEHHDLAYTDREPDEIRSVTVELKLDVSGLFEEEKNELTEKGFSHSVVTLHNVNGKDIITARKGNGPSGGIFTCSNVKPGIYIVRATLTQKLVDNYVINLFGEKTAYITHENNDIELYIKKYEATD